MISDDLLHGRSVLVVDDDPMIADELAELLDGFDMSVLGPCRSVSEAEDMLLRQQPDCAVLDISLAGKMSFPFAEVMCKRKVPFLFLSGHSSIILPPALADQTVLPKPFNRRSLERALHALLDTAPACAPV